MIAKKGDRRTTMSNEGGEENSVHGRSRSRGPFAAAVLFALLAFPFSTVRFDIDELGFSIEPYQFVGGDYTRHYLRVGDYGQAFRTSLKSYIHYWSYRPLFSPAIPAAVSEKFEREFDDVVRKGGADAGKLVAPYPDRIRHGAGKPLLPGLVTLPFIGVANLIAPRGENHNYFQKRFNYHIAFAIMRLPAFFCGLLSLLFFHALVRQTSSETDADRATLVFAVMPVCVMYFPNIHHDAYAMPFILLSCLFFLREEYWKAGVFLGLAAACKNSWVFVWAGMIAYSLVQGAGGQTRPYQLARASIADD